MRRKLPLQSCWRTPSGVRRSQFLTANALVDNDGLEFDAANTASSINLIHHQFGCGLTVLLKRDVSRSKRLGFGAKLCIHPNQIEQVHATFSPTHEETQWSQRVLEAMEASNGAAVALDGKMIDRPVWLKAQRIAGAPAADYRLRV